MTPPPDPAVAPLPHAPCPPRPDNVPAAPLTPAEVPPGSYPVPIPPGKFCHGCPVAGSLPVVPCTLLPALWLNPTLPPCPIPQLNEPP